MRLIIASLAVLAIAVPVAAQNAPPPTTNTMSTTTTTSTTPTTTTHKVVRHHKPVRHHRRHKVVRHKHVTHIKAKVTTSTTK